MAREVRHNEAASRYELFDGDSLIGIADYSVRGNVAVFPHTEIAAHLRGQGFGAELVRAALDDVRARGLTVVPQCWYVAEFIEANPEYHDLVAA